MSSAIILRAASTSFFWSTAADAFAVPEEEMGLEPERFVTDELPDVSSFLWVRVCAGGT